MTAKYKYVVYRYDRVYHNDLEYLLNHSVRNGGRVASFDWIPATLTVVVEHETGE